MKIAAALAALALVSQSSVEPPKPAPRVVFAKLQTSPFRNSDLPRPFALPSAKEVPHPGFPTAWSPSHSIPWRAGGAELAFALKGPDRVDLLGYTVYATHKQALAALAKGPKGHHFGFAPANARLVGKVPGFRMSTIWRAEVAGNEIVEADVVGSGPVAVRSLTVFPKTSKDPGVPRNVALIKAGLKHLAAVNRH